MALIEVQDISKTFRPRRGARSTLLGSLQNLNPLKSRSVETVRALEDLSFTVDPGETFGIIGANGSGKSTLLKILAGVTTPTSGEVTIHGRVASLLELGAGFHPVLSARENIFLNGRLLGMSRADIEREFDRIVAFSGVGEFIDNALDTFSSGMYVRLGFAVAVHSNPDVFLVDEVLSVGDEEFQRKCRKRIGELREQGKTILFVSHDLGIVSALCDRVMLLSKGKMISRGTPRETIDFYLRQVGHQKAVHTCGSGATEAIFNSGRVSLFHDQHEITAPAGLVCQVLHMGGWHEATMADWAIEESGSTHCVARGQATRLPIDWLVRIEVADGTVRYSIGFESRGDIDIEDVAVDFFLPVKYTSWLDPDGETPFPEIVSQDVRWMPLSSREAAPSVAAALSGDGSEAPEVLVRFAEKNDHDRLIWWNTDYVQGMRVLRAGGPVPKQALPFKAGRHELVTLEIALGQDRAAINAQVAAEREACSVTADGLSATFRQGQVRLSVDGADVTAFMGFYTSMLIGNLWNDSQCLQWDDVRRQGDMIEATGTSRRFPFRQHWRFEKAADGIAVQIELEVIEPFECQEYHACACLNEAYSEWESDVESGAFPPFDPSQSDWRHANRDYRPGTRITARGPDLPSVVLEAAEDAPMRMTAINTGYHQRARVLQALGVSDEGAFHFTPGRHPYFQGTIKIAR
ncbi:MAG: ABC transporter ATP-binding protein [bacterium]|nr:ABC transporter ATP-binding protein [bacterium]